MEEKNDLLNIDEAELTAIENYWTEERMRNAIPHPILEISDSDLEQFKTKKKSTTDIESVEGKKLNYDTFNITPKDADVSKQPFCNAGKLFFTKPDGRNYMGSAEFCGNDQIVLTAAHCVRDHITGDWYQNMLFCPGYANGCTQKFVIVGKTTKQGWANNKNKKPYHLDYSFLITKAKSKTGYFGWKTYNPYSRWTSIGYPSNYGHAEYMKEVKGDIASTKKGLIEMSNNPMTQGCSGGAWIGDLNDSDKKGGNYAIGLNSFGHKKKPGFVWSPLFDSKFEELYHYAKSKLPISISQD
ncbi:trypsin-like serine peptidase [Psychroserpens mesophilus]|uniref:trypsin-like serine peptidase n=1 Tax=Psychroserpens mesophilus TaxID=325473 RepID=UPI003F496075